MNKAEQKEFERLKMLLALRHYPEVLPDVAPPESRIGSFGELTTGYMFNAYSKTVSCACSSSTSHAIGLTNRTTSQRPIFMYSTKKLALKAMLYEMSQNFASALRDVEKKIEAEE
jgi:hypothetical protein